MKTILFALAAHCLAFSLPAQGLGLKIFPDPTERPQYPDLETTYYIFPWSPGCHVLDTVIGGQVVHQGYYDGKLTVTIIWQEPADSMPGRIEVSREAASCLLVAPGQTWDVQILTFSTMLPVVTGDDYFYMGQFNNVTLQAELNSFVGTLPPSYEWRVPVGSGWDVSVFGAGGANAFIFIPSANALREGCVRVRGKYPNSNWTAWKYYCLQGTIPAPCPVQLIRPLILCGDTTEQMMYGSVTGLPQMPQYPWSPTAYNWTVPSAWEFIGSNPSASNYASVKLDGHTDGLISLAASAGDFTSTVCEYAVNFLPAAPATTVLGPDYVCEAGDFRLSIQPPPESEVTWQVVPLDLATPQVVLPDHGSGAAAFRITDPSVSGHFRIIYTVANACGSIQRSRDFFVGKPRFFNTTLDGAAYTARPLCAGGHGVTTEVDGMSDPAVVWSASPGATGYLQRDSFVFLLAPAGEGNCPVVTASASNVCGTTGLPLTFCPQPDCSRPPVDLRVYPNPAYLIVSLETTADDPVSEDYALIEHVEIFNHLGQLVTTWHEPPAKRMVKAVVDLPNGVYTLRATVWGQPIIKRLLIARLF